MVADGGHHAGDKGEHHQHLQYPEGKKDRRAEAGEAVEILEDGTGVLGLNELVERPEEHHDENAQTEQKQCEGQVTG